MGVDLMLLHTTTLGIADTLHIGNRVRCGAHGLCKRTFERPKRPGKLLLKFGAENAHY